MSENELVGFFAQQRKASDTVSASVRGGNAALIVIAIMILSDSVALQAYLGIMAFGIWLCVLGLLIINRAVRSHGYCRRIVGYFSDFDYPPLDEWEEDLESRGAFTNWNRVSYTDN